MHAMPATASYLCHLDELQDGEARGCVVENMATVIAIQHQGRVYAYRDDCPHVPGSPLAWRRNRYLSADHQYIVCHAHGARFDITTGSCLLGPCLGKALTPVAVTLRPDGEVHLA